MKSPGLFDLFKKNKNSDDEKRKNQASGFIICFFIAIIIWLLIKLSQFYVDDINYPIVFTNIPSNELLVNASDTNLSVLVKAKGFRLMSIKYFSRNSPIYIDVSKLPVKKIKRTYKSGIRTSLLYNVISRNLKSGDEIISIYPDTLSLLFDELYNKKLPVKSNVKISLQKQYLLYDSIKFIPDSVVVTGPFSVINDINFVETTEKKFLLLDKKVADDIPLIMPDVNSNIKYSTNFVRVFIDVEKFTEESLEAPVNVISSSKDENVFKFFPERVKITYIVALKDFKRIDTKMFTVIAKYLDDSISDNKKLDVEVANAPDFVKITKITPEKVEYIILK